MQRTLGLGRPGRSPIELSSQVVRRDISQWAVGPGGGLGSPIRFSARVVRWDISHELSVRGARWAKKSHQSSGTVRCKILHVGVSAGLVCGTYLINESGYVEVPEFGGDSGTGWVCWSLIN